MFFALHFDFIYSSLIFAIRVLINFTRQLLHILYFFTNYSSISFIPRSLCVHFLANYRFWRINAFLPQFLLILPTNFSKTAYMIIFGTPTCSYILFRVYYRANYCSYRSKCVYDTALAFAAKCL